jgi:hypothetical protein
MTRYLCLLLLAAGCSPSPEEACEKLMPAYCSKLSECAPILFNPAFTDVASCSTRLKINCTSIFSAPGTSSSTGRAIDCANAINALTCADFYAGTQPEACKPLAGQNANGTACTNNDQCQSTWCAKANNQTCGTCGPIPTEGTSCANQDCPNGLQCASGNKTCVKPGMAGTACDANHPCQGGLACKGATPGGMGTCALALQAGAMCDRLLGPNNAGCDQTKGLFCHPSTSVCTSVVWAKVGEACGTNLMTQTFAICTGSSRCTAQNNGTCMAPAADGAPCDDTNGPRCAAPAKCVSGACRLEDPLACK